MTATALKPREFDSYFQEYLLLTSEIEINAYWKRMDEIVVNMTDEEKSVFFGQLDKSLRHEVEESRKLRAEIEATYFKDKD